MPGGGVGAAVIYAEVIEEVFPGEAIHPVLPGDFLPGLRRISFYRTDESEPAGDKFAGLLRLWFRLRWAGRWGSTSWTESFAGSAGHFQKGLAEGELDRDEAGCSGGSRSDEGRFTRGEAGLQHFVFCQ